MQIPQTPRPRAPESYKWKTAAADYARGSITAPRPWFSPCRRGRCRPAAEFGASRPDGDATSWSNGGQIQHPCHQPPPHPDLMIWCPTPLAGRCGISKERHSHPCSLLLLQPVIPWEVSVTVVASHGCGGGVGQESCQQDSETIWWCYFCLAGFAKLSPDLLESVVAYVHLMIVNKWLSE
jgi:hypothetical protein